MTNKLQTLFPAKGAYAGADTVNHAGAPAFTRSLEEQAVQVLMTGNLESTYYCSAENLAAEAIDTLTKMAAKDPEFLAQAILYARNEGYLRVAPIVGLLVLSKARPDLFRRIFDKVILQPGDLQDFVTLVRSKSVRSTGKSIRKAVEAWLNRISEYHVVKYGAPQKKPGAGSPTNLRDVLRLIHPKPADEARQVLFSYIVSRIKGTELSKEEISKLPPKIKAYESFKDLTASPELAKANEEKALALVTEHDLPYEVVTARLSSPAAWKALASKAPFMNMLRNLNNYEKNGVFKDAAVKAQIIKRLTDPEQVSKSKQFPFRFLAAYNAFQGDADVRDAIVRAVELSVSNIPELGITLVAPDESGSMDSPVSEKSDITMKQIGNLFAAALWKRSAGGFMVPFDTAAYPVGYGGRVTANKRDSIVTVAQQLGVYNGGTNLSAPLEWALGQKFDTGVFITDSESWADLLAGGSYRYGNRGVLDKIRAYRSKNPKAQFFFIQLVQNSALAAPQNEPGVHYIYGWSDAVLRYIGQAMSGKGQISAVRAVEIPKFEVAPTVVVSAPARKVVKPAKVVRKAVKPSKAVVKPKKARRA
jgi:60 kDa SS-A/Ro ribonucleoprotein